MAKYHYCCASEQRKLLRRELEGMGLQPSPLDPDVITVDHPFDNIGWTVGKPPKHTPCFAQGVVVAKGTQQSVQWLTKRMRDNPQAPSRSYLKLEEVFSVSDLRPSKGDNAVDMGSAPGGWSYCLTERGISVLAIDNGPMKFRHRKMQHIHADAYTWMPPKGVRYDWLVCDIIDKPKRTIEMLNNWVARRWCLQFVVTIKTGRQDPLAILETMRDSQLARKAKFEARQLFHNREEFTVWGRTNF